MSAKSVVSLVEENNVVTLVAHQTESEYTQEIDELMVTLGNEGRAIPFYVTFPSDGRPPITILTGLVTEKQIIDVLEEAGPSLPSDVDQPALTKLSYESPIAEEVAE